MDGVIRRQGSRLFAQEILGGQIVQRDIQSSAVRGNAELAGESAPQQAYSILVASWWRGYDFMHNDAVPLASLPQEPQPRRVLQLYENK